MNNQFNNGWDNNQNNQNNWSGNQQDPFFQDPFATNNSQGFDNGQNTPPQQEQSQKPAPTGFGKFSFIGSIIAPILVVVIFTIAAIVNSRIGINFGFFSLFTFLLGILDVVKILSIVFGSIQRNINRKRGLPTGRFGLSVALSVIFLIVNFTFIIIISVWYGQYLFHTF
ncbi:MAG: hypothetical protein FWC11_01685 [Firmicutes bacterium]|nr:hypothetical protein [Bacillota bacterium]MCL2255552.1 hypothetical protein [Bacillota bacterium]